MVLDDVVGVRTYERSDFPTPQDLQTRYLNEVLRFVSSLIRPLADAEDVTMEVFQAAFLSIHKLRGTEDPRLWLLGIARRKVADALRTRYRRKESPLSDAAKSDNDSQTRVEVSALVREILEKLPSDQSEALILKYSNGLTTRELAVVLRRSEAATNSLLQRARDSFYAKGAPHFLIASEVDHV